jgi:hypothetical protein
LWVGNKLIYFIQINPFELNDEDVKNIRPTSSENLLSEVNKKKRRLCTSCRIERNTFFQVRYYFHLRFVFINILMDHLPLFFPS